MTPKAQACLRAILSLKPHKEELLRLLPPQIAEGLQSQRIERNFNPALLFSYPFLEKIHFSWFIDMVRQSPSAVKSLFLGALSFSQFKGLKQRLSFSETPKSLSPFLLSFLSHILYKNLDPHALPHQQLISITPLNCLLELDHAQLRHLADYLGLHDLAIDLRQVIDKEVLNKVYSALSSQQRHQLDYYSKQPVKWIPPKLNLAGWEGSSEQLHALLHQRGLIRIAKATAGEEESFKWYLLRRFDVGRAKVLQKEYLRKQDSALAPYFKNQILHIAKRFR